MSCFGFDHADQSLVAVKIALVKLEATIPQCGCRGGAVMVQIADG